MRVLRELPFASDPVLWSGAEAYLASGRNGGLPQTGPGSHEPVAVIDSPPSPELELQHAAVLEESRRAASAEGREEGRRLGREEADQEWRQRLDAERVQVEQTLRQMREAVETELESFFGEIERVLPEVAIEIARKVVDAEVRTNPEVVRAALSQVVRRLKGPELTIRYHPDDLSWLEADLQRLNENGEGKPGEVQFVADEAIARGGVVADSGQGTVDACVSTKLELLKAEVC